MKISKTNVFHGLPCGTFLAMNSKTFSHYTRFFFVKIAITENKNCVRLLSQFLRTEVILRSAARNCFYEFVPASGMPVMFLNTLERLVVYKVRGTLLFKTIKCSSVAKFILALCGLLIRPATENNRSTEAVVDGRNKQRRARVDKIGNSILC